MKWYQRQIYLSSSPRESEWPGGKLLLPRRRAARRELCAGDEADNKGAEAQTAVYMKRDNWHRKANDEEGDKNYRDNRQGRRHNGSCRCAWLGRINGHGELL